MSEASEAPPPVARRPSRQPTTGIIAIATGLILFAMWHIGLIALAMALASSMPGSHQGSQRSLGLGEALGRFFQMSPIGTFFGLLALLVPFPLAVGLLRLRRWARVGFFVYSVPMLVVASMWKSALLLVFLGILYLVAILYLEQRKVEQLFLAGGAAPVREEAAPAPTPPRVAPVRLPPLTDIPVGIGLIMLFYLLFGLRQTWELLSLLFLYRGMLFALQGAFAAALYLGAFVGLLTFKKWGWWLAIAAPPLSILLSPLVLMPRAVWNLRHIYNPGTVLLVLVIGGLPYAFMVWYLVRPATRRRFGVPG